MIDHKFSFRHGIVHHVEEAMNKEIINLGHFGCFHSFHHEAEPVAHCVDNRMVLTIKIDATSLEIMTFKGRLVGRGFQDTRTELDRTTHNVADVAPLAT